MGALMATDAGVHRIGPDGVEVVYEGPVVAATTDSDGVPWVLDAAGRVLRQGDSAWDEVGALGPSLRGTCLLPLGDHALVGTHEAHLARVSAQGCELLESFEHAPGRAEWHTPWGGPPSTRSLARTGSGAVLVNVHVGGLLRSDDHGATWTPLVDIEVDVHQVVAGDGDLVLAACGAGGLYVSDDGGQRWHTAVEGLHGTYCRAVAVAGGHALVSASTGPFTREAALYRADLRHPGRLERCDRGLPEWFATNIDTHWLAGRGDAAAVATDDGQVFLSPDGGEHWDQLADGLPAPAALVLT